MRVSEYVCVVIPSMYGMDTVRASITGPQSRLGVHRPYREPREPLHIPTSAIHSAIMNPSLLLGLTYPA